MKQLLRIEVEAIYDGLNYETTREAKNSWHPHIINLNDISYIDELNTTIFMKSNKIAFFVTDRTMDHIDSLVNYNE